MHKALAIIRGEHRSLATVLHGLQYLVSQVGTGKAAPNFTVLRAMIEYINAFPVRLHHPKENEYLFSALRRRGADIVPLLDELEMEHVKDAQYAHELKDALARFEQRSGEFDAFAAAVDHYAEFQWTHMRKEEDLVLPAAQKLLQHEDWANIDAAFESNTDPLVGADIADEFRELFRRILTVAPTPIGLGRP